MPAPTSLKPCAEHPPIPAASGLAAPASELDRITQTAARMFRMPMALVTILDDQRQWFRSRYGLAMESTPQDISFCTHAIQQPSPMVVCDAAKDPRFHDNPLVTGHPNIRFYAGHTIHSRRGRPLGTLCVMDTQPRAFTEDDRAVLANLAMMVEKYFQLGEAAAENDATKAARGRNQTMASHMVDQAPVGIALLDTRGGILECNRRFADVTCHVHERIAGTTLDSVLAPEDRERVLHAAQEVRNVAGAARHLELRLPRADGSRSWVKLGLSALTNDQRPTDYLIAVATDTDELHQTQSLFEKTQLDLEAQVRARTAELSATVKELQAEVARRRAAQAALEANKDYFQQVLENTSDAFIEIDGEDRIVTWNGSAERIFGWSAAEAVGQCYRNITVPPALRARHIRWLKRLNEAGISTRMKRRIEIDGLRRSGETFPLEMTFSTSFESGQLLVHGFLHDISQRKADEAALRETTLKLKTITDNVPAMIAHIGADFRYRFHNQAYAGWFDLAPQGLVGSHVKELWGEALFDRLRPVLEGVMAGEHATIEYSLQARQGLKWFYANLVPQMGAEGTNDGFYILSHDISERKRLYERVEHEAMHDALTGLPNRRALMEHLSTAMARARRGNGHLAVMFMDLDGFKQINDTLGHEFGDALLKQFAAHVSATVRETDFVARLAGDEFVVVMEDVQQLPDGIAAMGNAILQRINADRDVLGVSMHLSSSVGVVLYHQANDKSPQQLITRADAAMYEAKALGKNQVVLR